MKVLEVLVEHRNIHLDRPFSYLYYGNKKIDAGYRVTIKFNNQNLVGYVLSCKETNKTKEELEEENGFEFSVIDDILDDAPLLNEELLKLCDEITSYYVAPKISVLQAMLPASLAPRSSTLKAPKIAYEYFASVINDSEEGLTAKQVELLRLIAREGMINKRDVSSKAILEKLLEAKRVELIRQEKRRLSIPNYEYQQPPVLTDDQQNVFNEIINSDDLIFLLQGVTGSGKTEVYLRLIEETLSNRKSAIFLVPEISLTPMMMEYLLRRFNKKVAILHSELTQAEKYDEYRKIASGECPVVIGARSAIFAPVKNLGLIILDEEHVESYKQDNSPYYHAREVAIMRSKMNHAKLVMGSATPSLESETRALKGVYHLLKLPKRINKRDLPETRIINLCDKRNIDRESYIFSLPLRKAIKETIDKGEQIILLLNRRGFSTNITCRNCGYTFECENCGIALTYHKTDNMLKCHHCEHVEEFPTICPKCGGHHFMKLGFGSEKVEEEILRLFPEAKTIRLDSDSTKARNKIPSLIEKFRNKEANILIGTQMIAKGHDFPGVSLVGIVLADIGLAMPSYRSSERVFQLITQAIGRCGRGEIPGIAYIQTYMPTHYSITLAAKQDYAKFYLTEMANRKLQNYPPFYYLSSINLNSKNKQFLDENADLVIKFLNDSFEGEKAIVLGPITPYYAYKKEGFEKQILVKYKNPSVAREIFKDLVNTFKFKSNIDISLNIDSYNF